MKAFITGVPGFAGSHLAEYLLDQGDQILGCSATGRWRPGTPENLRRQVPLFSWSLTEKEADDAFDALLRFQPDVVYHLAAVAVPGDCGRSEPNPRAWDVNVEGTKRLIQQIQRLPAVPRFLMISTCHVYAPVDSEQPLDENAPLGPLTGYGKTKLAAEQEVAARCEMDGLDGLILRPFKHAGPRQNDRLMLAEWAIQIAEGSDSPIRVLNLDSYFDMTDVRDVVRAYRELAVHGKPGEIYNIGSGICLRSGDVFQRLYELADCRRPMVELSPGIHREPIADVRRLQQRTGWRPEISLDKTLQDAVDYWRSMTTLAAKAV